MNTNLFMLDTNTVSYVLKGLHLNVRRRLNETPMENICISVITEAELLLGVAKTPKAIHLPLAVKEFLLRVDILAWDSEAAASYASLRSNCEKEGLSLGNMDMLIAAHSVSSSATLVTNDKAFFNVGHYLKLEDWTRV